MTLCDIRKCPSCGTECEIRWGYSGNCPNCESEYKFIEKHHIGRRGDFSWQEIEWTTNKK